MRGKRITDRLLKRAKLSPGHRTIHMVPRIEEQKIRKGAQRRRSEHPVLPADAGGMMEIFLLQPATDIPSTEDTETPRHGGNECVRTDVLENISLPHEHCLGTDV